MGKSPGKWIKTLLFGKKSFKSRSSKGRPSGTNSMDLTADGGSDLTANSLVISDPIPVNTSQVGYNLELEKEALACVYGGECALEERESTVSKVLDDPKRTLQEQAAIKAQAAFRGYLSRRAFRALKGIIRLQALIRGHLVRRQAVATLHCMRAIVSIQALVRSKRVTHDKGVQVAKHADPSGRNLSSGRMKASTNAFVRKLLGSQITARPLKISYHLESPNSAWSWLERWSTSRFWRPPPQKKKAVDPKPQRRHHNMEMESGRPKRSVRRNFGANTESGSHGMVASDPEKPRRNLRKVSTHPSEVVVDNPQGDLEKVKRNLRRISSVAGDSSDRGAHETDRAKAKMTVTNGGPPDLIEVESEKAKISSPKVSSPTANAPVRIANGDAEEAKNNKDAADLIPEPIQNPQTSSNIIVVGTNVSATEILVDSDAVSAENTEENGKMSTDDGLQNEEAIPLPAPTEEPAEAEGCTVMTPHPPENGATEESTPRGLSNLEEQASHESHKTFKRRDSFSAKPECAAENIVQNSPVLPSYMATTESAKAKARGQSSPRLSTEGVDKTAFTRRHSLPSSTNGKPTSLSPRTQRLAPTSCKGGIRSERSLLSSSRDNGTEKPIHVEWRR